MAAKAAGTTCTKRWQGLCSPCPKPQRSAHAASAAALQAGFGDFQVTQWNSTLLVLVGKHAAFFSITLHVAAAASQAGFGDFQVTQWNSTLLVLVGKHAAFFSNTLHVAAAASQAGFGDFQVTQWYRTLCSCFKNMLLHHKMMMSMLLLLHCIAGWLW
jgi:hypothetical protein